MENFSPVLKFIIGAVAFTTIVLFIGIERLLKYKESIIANLGTLWRKRYATQKNTT